MACRSCLRIVALRTILLYVMATPLHAQTYVAVPTAGSASVKVVDLDLASVVATHVVGGDGYGLAVQADGRRSYVAQVHASNLSAVEFQPASAQTVGQGFTMHGTAVAADGRTLYATIRDGSQVAILNPLTLQETARINGLSNPGGVYADPQGRYLAVSSYGFPFVLLYDLRTNLRRYAQLPGTGGWALAGSANGNRLYVQAASGYVAEIDPVLGGTLRTSLAPSVEGALALTPDAHRLYLATQGTALVSFDTETLTRLPDLDTGGAAGVDVAADGEHVWVIRPADERLSAYSVVNNALLADIAVPGITRAMGRFVPQAPNATGIWDLDDDGQSLLGQTDLTIAGDATFVSGAIGHAAVQCGRTAISTTLPALASMDSFSLTLWIRPDVLPADTAFIAGQASALAPEGWWLGLHGNRLRLKGFSAPALEASAPIIAGHWQQVVMTADAANVSLYLNGVVVGSSTRTALQPAGNTLRFCADNALTATPLNGALDQIASYARALSANEVQVLQWLSPSVRGQVSEPGFETGPVDTTMNAIPSWRFVGSNHNDFGDYGSSPTGQWQARVVNTHRHHGDLALESWVRNQNGGSGSDGNSRKATLSMGMPDDQRFAHRATSIELWRSEPEWTTSARWYHRLLLTMGDQRTQHSVLLYCRAWGMSEGCEGNYFDGSDGTEAGADGQTWYRHRVGIPNDLDHERLWLRIEHEQDSWDGSSAESTFYLDDIRLIGQQLGSELATASFGNNQVLLFAQESQGNLTPTRSIAGPGTALNQPNGVAFSASELFVGNHAGQSVNVYPRDANGNVAPSRIITGNNTGLGLVTHVRVYGDELWVASYGAALRVFHLDDGGNVAPKRVLNAMTSVYGIAFSNDEVYLSRHPDTGDQNIYVFARTASGNAQPLRVIAGLGLNFPSGLAVVGNELLVSDYFNAALRIYPRLATGNVAALRVITDSSGLGSPADVWVRDQEILVAARASNSLRVYGLSDSGEVSPRRVIAGPGTNLSEPLSIIDSSLPASPDAMFRDGFEN